MTLFTVIKSWLHRLFGKDEKTAQPVNQKKMKKLSRADRKQIEAAIARANRTDKKKKSAQDSIPYERMWPDGICRVAGSRYTKTIQFQDINYQLSQNEDKTAIFEGWCDFLNYFDSSIQFQLSFLNLAASEETFARAINIPLQGDDFDSIRVEYTTMLQNQLARGNNGLIKTKYLTFGIDADSLKAAKPRLERIETDILNNVKRLGVAAETLDGKARLAQLHGIFHMDEQVPFGIEVNRGGMACCPFHDDKNPSMKLNEEYFYCFGCGATGDVIDFTARLYNLSPKEAAEKLAQDFGLAYDSQAPPRRRHVRQKSEAQKFKEDRDHAFRVLADYFHLLRKWETDYTPKTPEENPHPRFMEAIQKKDYVGYLLDFFLENSPEEQKLWIAEHQSEIAKLERRVKFMADKTTNRERLQEITAGIEQGIKELFESEKYIGALLCPWSFPLGNRNIRSC